MSYGERTTIVMGPPGTGKTTKLLSIVDELLRSGVPPDQICYLAFTRKAATEAINRAMEKFQFDRDQLPWFRTIHSLAFKQLNKNSRQMMGIGDYVRIAKECGVYISFRTISEDGSFAGYTKGDRMMFMEVMARNLQVPLREYWNHEQDPEITYQEVEHFRNVLEAHKAGFGKQDFTDLLTEFVDEGPLPPHKYLIIDEAQDLSPLQWRVADKLAEPSKMIYVAGDDDQAIFTWAGADVDHFIDMPGKRIVLAQSYRVPARVARKALEVCGNIAKRVDKNWLPREAPGEVQYIADLGEIDMSRGTWLLLARNVYLLDSLAQECVREGYLFSGPGVPGVNMKNIGVVRLWEKLRAGHYITVEDARLCYDLISKENIQHGGKAKLDVAVNRKVKMEDLKQEYGLLTDDIWHVALDRLEPMEREYFIAALRRGEKMQREPRIKVSTIHGVKGGEADNVVIVTDMAKRTFQEFAQDPDAEHRVWYVAVTRARERVFILQNQTTQYYPL